MTFTTASSYYTIQTAQDLGVHLTTPAIKPQAPLLVLLGNVGDPLDVSFDSFLAWCSRQWQRVFLVPGQWEAAAPLAVEGTCRNHNNVTLLVEGSVDTSLAGLALSIADPPASLANPSGGKALLCASRGLPDTTLRGTGVHTVPVSVPQLACTVQEGWSKVPPVVYHGAVPATDGDAPDRPACRVCGYTTHTTAECPFSWAEKMRHANKRLWRADQSRWRSGASPPSKSSRCASAPAVTG